MRSSSKRIIAYSCVGAAILGSVLTDISSKRGFGIRGTEVVREFNYEGKPARLMREKARIAPDKYYFAIDGKASKLKSIETNKLMVSIYRGFLNLGNNDTAYTLKEK